MAAHAISHDKEAQADIDEIAVLVGGSRTRVGEAGGGESHERSDSIGGECRASHSNSAQRRQTVETKRLQHLHTWYTPAVVSAPLQPVMARATAHLERGHAAAAADLLAPLL